MNSITVFNLSVELLTGMSNQSHFQESEENDSTDHVTDSTDHVTDSTNSACNKVNYTPREEKSLLGGWKLIE
jgi:hypothetical protein